MANYSLQYCGVPQCKTYRKPGISMHQIPHWVTKNRKELLKWKILLKMRKPFPKNFAICSLHFRKEEILVPLARGKRVKCLLLNSAIPSQRLPKSSTYKRKCIQQIKKRYTRLKDRNSRKDCFERVHLMPSELFAEEEDDNPTNPLDALRPSTVSVGVQHSVMQNDKCVQVGAEMHLYSLPFLVDSDDKISLATGIPSRRLLTTIVECCLKVRSSENRSSLEQKIILTMFRIQHNCSNAITALLFNIAAQTAKTYFTECVQLLSEALQSSIYWQTREENRRNLPACFARFPNTMTVLDCTETKTAQTQCITCKSSSCSHYKECHTVKIFIGFSPSGLVNYVSTAVAGRTSDKAVSNLSNLLEKLKAGDAVMVDKGFMTGNELLDAGIEVIRPQSMSQESTQLDIERDQLVAAAQVHIERRLSRLKVFKMLSEKISLSILPYLGDVVTVVCAVFNLGAPILGDDIFM